MLDSTHYTELSTDLWRDTLCHGDIVLFRFPHSEACDGAEIKARPCLVLDIETLGEIRYAVVAYGTTSRRKSNVGEEIHVRKREAFTAAGLNEPTRFIGARRILVLLTHKAFVEVAKTGSPVVGTLVGSELERLNVVRGRIHALRDIAAETQGPQSSNPRRRRSHLGLRPMRGVTVEYRDLPSRLAQPEGAQ